MPLCSDYITQELWVENAKESLQPRVPFQEPLKMELQHFAQCIQEKKNPLITGEDGIKALQIAIAALESSTKKTAIKIKPL